MLQSFAKEYSTDLSLIYFTMDSGFILENSVNMFLNPEVQVIAWSFISFKY